MPLLFSKCCKKTSKKSKGGSKFSNKREKLHHDENYPLSGINTHMRRFPIPKIKTVKKPKKNEEPTNNPSSIVKLKKEPFDRLLTSERDDLLDIKGDSVKIQTYNRPEVPKLDLSNINAGEGNLNIKLESISVQTDEIALIRYINSKYGTRINPNKVQTLDSIIFKSQGENAIGKVEFTSPNLSIQGGSKLEEGTKNKGLEMELCSEEETIQESEDEISEKKENKKNGLDSEIDLKTIENKGGMPFKHNPDSFNQINKGPPNRFDSSSRKNSPSNSNSFPPYLQKELIEAREMTTSQLNSSNSNASLNINQKKLKSASIDSSSKKQQNKIKKPEKLNNLKLDSFHTAQEEPEPKKNTKAHQERIGNLKRNQISSISTKERDYYFKNTKKYSQLPVFPSKTQKNVQFQLKGSQHSDNSIEKTQTSNENNLTPVIKPRDVKAIFFQENESVLSEKQSHSAKNKGIRIGSYSLDSVKLEMNNKGSEKVSTVNLTEPKPQSKSNSKALSSEPSQLITSFGESSENENNSRSNMPSGSNLNEHNHIEHRKKVTKMHYRNFKINQLKLNIGQKSQVEKKIAEYNLNKEISIEVDSNRSAKYSDWHYQPGIEDLNTPFPVSKKFQKSPTLRDSLTSSLHSPTNLNKRNKYFSNTLMVKPNTDNQKNPISLKKSHKYKNEVPLKDNEEIIEIDGKMKFQNNGKKYDTLIKMGAHSS